MIEIDLEARRIHACVSDQEFANRKSLWKPAEQCHSRGYGRLFLDEVTQAHEGCDFRFLERGVPTPEPDIF